jgi:hypothetical protein
MNRGVVTALRAKIGDEGYLKADCPCYGSHANTVSRFPLCRVNGVLKDLEGFEAQDATRKIKCDFLHSANDYLRRDEPILEVRVRPFDRGPNLEALFLCGGKGHPLTLPVIYLGR